MAAQIATGQSRRIGQIRISGKFMGTPAAKPASDPPPTARAKTCPKIQLTLPEEIQRTLHIGKGDLGDHLPSQADNTLSVFCYRLDPTTGVYASAGIHTGTMNITAPFPLTIDLAALL
jgi:hypothetical protein